MVTSVQTSTWAKFTVNKYKLGVTKLPVLVISETETVFFHKDFFFFF